MPKHNIPKKIDSVDDLVSDCNEKTTLPKKKTKITKLLQKNIHPIKNIKKTHKI
jgi:hypothetical protein